MAKNKADLFALINANEADNTTGQITASKVREVDTQVADSALNVLEASAQTVAGPVNFTGLLQKGGKSVLVSAVETDILRASSTASTQEPTSLGVPIQVEFGPAQNTASDPVMLSSAGAITINQTGTYAIRFKLQFGRSGASGISYLATRIMKGAAQFGATQCTRLSSSDSIIPTDSRVVMSLLAGDVITMQLIRDSLGTNAGGLFAQTSSHGWALAPSALLVVSRIDGVTS
jgi:hypothetical protein